MLVLTMEHTLYLIGQETLMLHPHTLAHDGARGGELFSECVEIYSEVPLESQRLSAVLHI